MNYVCGVNIKRVCGIVGCMASMLMGLVGCSTVPTAMPNDPLYAPVQPTELAPPPVETGSLYQAQFSNNLWTDQRAKRVGDIITVVLEEQTTSSKSANTSLTKDSTTEIGDATVLGTTPHLSAAPLFPSHSSLSLNTSLSGEREFAGEADADQSNSLSGNITVTISQVLPNGMLRIRGEKWLTLSRGEEFIRITGLVRPADVRPDNTVLSTRVADARIAYSGTGELAEANQMGWLTRFFNHPLWPF
ncbi:MAG: flagellar basal body L-ring protein FlgH [Gammaproteobacteria bacterium]